MVASDELGNGPQVLENRLICLAELVPSPIAPVLTWVSGWPDRIMWVATLVPIALFEQTTAMGTSVSDFMAVLPGVSMANRLEVSMCVATLFDLSLLEHAHRPLLLHVLVGERASVARLTTPVLLFVIMLTADDEKAGGGILWLTIATGRASIVEPTTRAPLPFPLLIVANATEVGLLQLPGVANPSAALPMQRLLLLDPAVSIDLGDRMQVAPLVFICIQLVTPTATALCEPIPSGGVPGCSAGGNMLHVGIRTNVAEATLHAAPAIAHGIEWVLLARLMETMADPLLFPIPVRLAVDGLMLIPSLPVALDGPVTYREILILMACPLTAVVDGMWQLQVAGGLTAVPGLMPIANAVALSRLVPLVIARTTQNAFVRLGAANETTPLPMSVLETFRDLSPPEMARLAPLLETLPSAIGIAVVARGCSATLLLCVHMLELDVFRNMFISIRVRVCRLA